MGKVVRCTHVLDSGAHSWINKLYKHTKDKGKKIDWSIYEGPEFWDYVDRYAAFVKRHKSKIDHYVNVDVIRNPDKSWEVQKYLEEKHGLNPMPVVHFGAEVKHLERYLDAGYRYIGLGGRLGRIPYFPWADEMWHRICQGPNKMPLCKVHGFSVTTHRHMTRYPWYSVDSVTWKKMSYYGQILVPPKRHGEFCFTIPNLVIFIDPNSQKYTTKQDNKDRGRHFLHLDRKTQQDIREWLELIEVPFGSNKRNGSVKRIGVINENDLRCKATIAYFEALQKHIPKWPWSFQSTTETSPLHERIQ